MSRAATADEIADHNRDLRKHDPRPTFDQRAAVSKIVGYAEGVCASGILPVQAEMQLRQIIAETLAAFHMPSQTERADA